MARELQVWWVEVYPTPDGKRDEVFVAWEDEPFVIRQLAKTPSVVILYYCSYLFFRTGPNRPVLLLTLYSRDVQPFLEKGHNFYCGSVRGSYA